MSNLSIALAGGVGAFLGACIGQMIQWLRDRWLAQVDDRRRMEDAQRELATEQRQARRDAYADILSSANTLRSNGIRIFLLYGALLGEPVLLHSIAELRREAGEQIDRAGNSFLEHSARIWISGSKEVNATVETINSSLVGLASSISGTAKKLVVHDQERFTELINKGQGLTGVPGISSLEEIPLKEQAKGLMKDWESIDGLIMELRTMIRSELGHE